MPPSVDDASELTYPIFDQGEDLIVKTHEAGVVEFHTHREGEYLWSDQVFDLRDVR